MTTDTLRRLQALRGLTRTGSTHTVLAAVQGDLQTVIEAVLELADCEDGPARPVEAPESDAQPEDVSVDPETENGPQNAAQGRIGWLLLCPDDEYRYLAREVPGGWTDTDGDGDAVWYTQNWPDAEFTPIRTLADDEVAVKRDDLCIALEWSDDGSNGTAPDIHAYRRLRAALEAGEDRG